MDLPLSRPAWISVNTLSGGQGSSPHDCGLGGINRLGFTPRVGPSLRDFAPERAAHRRDVVVMIERHDRVERELAIVHALGEDDMPVAIHRFRAEIQETSERSPGFSSVGGLVKTVFL